MCVDCVNSYVREITRANGLANGVISLTEISTYARSFSMLVNQDFFWDHSCERFTEIVPTPDNQVVCLSPLDRYLMQASDGSYLWTSYLRNNEDTTEQESENDNQDGDVNNKKGEKRNMETRTEDIRIGYELETNSWDSTQELDQEAYDNACETWVDRHMPDTSYLSDNTAQRVRDELFAAANENVDESDYQTDGELDTDAINEDCPDGLSAHRDGSVAGPEFVLSDPQTIADAKAMLPTLFRYVSQHGAEIDEGCSFHVHLSVVGRSHTYGWRLQALMSEYVLLQAHNRRLPHSLLYRWLHGPLSSYFRLNLTSEKYSFVAYRSYDDYATWEFRCFGNIDNSIDASTCIDVATEAYVWAMATIDCYGSSDACLRVFGTTERERVVDYLQGRVANLSTTYETLRRSA